MDVPHGRPAGPGHAPTTSLTNTPIVAISEVFEVDGSATGLGGPEISGFLVQRRETVWVTVESGQWWIRQDLSGPLRHGHKVTFAGFGTFYTRQQMEGKVRDIRGGKIITLPHAVWRRSRWEPC